MRKQLFIQCLIKVLVFTSVLIVVLPTVSCIKLPGSTVKIPITLNGASNIGSLQFELMYDTSVLVVRNIEVDSFSANAITEYNIENPGQVIIGIADATGIKSNTKIATVEFKIVQKDAECTITIENALAYDVNTLNSLSVSSSPGKYSGKGRNITPPIITIK